MGRRLVAAAYSPFGDLGLSTRARLVLLGMANMAHDGADPPIYYGGWAYLARGLGYADYGPVPERAVARCVAELRKAGLVIPDGDPSPGKNVTYRLRL